MSEADEESDRAGFVSDDEALQILRRFNSSHWKNDSERARYSIPADPKRDDDIRLNAYITQTRRLRVEADRLRQVLSSIADDTDADGFELRQRARAAALPEKK